MRTAIVVICSFALGVAVTTWLPAPATAQSQSGSTTELLRADLGDWCPGKEVSVAISANGPRTGVALAAGGAVPLRGSPGGRHFHPGHSFSWVIEGTETVRPDGKPAYDVKPGDLIHEEPRAISETVNAQPTKVLTFRILTKGEPATTYVN